MSAGVRKNVASRRSDIKYGVYVTQQLYISLFSEFSHLSILEIHAKDTKQCRLNNNIAPFSQEKAFKDAILIIFIHVNIICIKLAHFASFPSLDTGSRIIRNRLFQIEIQE